MSIEEERLLEKRDYFLCQIKNLEFELALDPVAEDEMVIREELKEAFSELDKINKILAEISK